MWFYWQGGVGGVGEVGGCPVAVLFFGVGLGHEFCFFFVGVLGVGWGDCEFVPALRGRAQDLWVPFGKLVVR